MPAVSSWCETRCHTVRDEDRLQVFESRVVRKMSGANRRKVCRKLHNEDILTKEDETSWAHVMHEEKNAEFWKENLRLEELGTEERIILKLILRK